MAEDPDVTTLADRITEGPAVSVEMTRPRVKVVFPNQGPFVWDEKVDAIYMDREFAVQLFFRLGFVLGMPMERMPVSGSGGVVS